MGNLVGFNNPLTGLNGALILPQVKSPNFVTGVSGWTIKKDGSAEFNNLTIRGTFFGTNFIVNSKGVFFYSGAPANGNLVISLAGVAGTDSFGNVYPQGLNITASGKSVVAGLTGGAPLIYFGSGIGTVVNGAAIQDIVINAGAAAYEFLQVLGAQDNTHNDLILSGWAASSADGSQVPTQNTQYKDNLGVFHVLESVTSVAKIINVLTTINNELRVTKNVVLGGAANLGDNGIGELQVANATTVPTTNPVGGFDLYAKQGVPSVRDPGGQTLGMVRSYSQNSTSNLISFTAEVDVPGATINVVVSGSNATVIVHGQFDMQLGTTVGDTMVGFLSWNAVDRPEQAVFIAPAVQARVCLGRTWRITGVTAGTYVAKLRASCTVSAANNLVSATHTGLVVEVIDQ
jgi:hypothetical protein